MKTVCEKNSCTGCMACVDVCPVGAVKIEDDLDAYRTVICEELCINCNECLRVCQKNNPATLSSPLEWYQGWANDVDVRKDSSSGGAAAEIARAFVAEGGIVCSCVFEDGFFHFKLVDSVADLKQFRGSKYVKSNPSGVYKSVKSELEKGKKVLFIGLPCQIAALKSYIGIRENLQKMLYTVDLICHGTPSGQLLEIFLGQYGYSLKELKEIQFRRKRRFQIYKDGKEIVTAGASDRYMIAFLNSLIYTENCYHCEYARKERAADITVGDSWGSELPEEEKKKGISLLLCQNVKGKELLKNADLHLEEVEIQKAVESNQQLKAPSEMPKSRSFFFKEIKKGTAFNYLVWRCFPRKCFRQKVKALLIRLKLFGGGIKRYIMEYRLWKNDAQILC